MTANAVAGDKLAPVDEYFGPTRMSPLEVTNRISDAEHRGANYDGLMNTQSAIEDWAQKYSLRRCIPIKATSKPITAGASFTIISPKSSSATSPRMAELHK